MVRNIFVILDVVWDAEVCILTTGPKTGMKSMNLIAARMIGNRQNTEFGQRLNEINEPDCGSANEFVIPTCKYSHNMKKYFGSSMKINMF